MRRGARSKGAAAGTPVAGQATRRVLAGGLGAAGLTGVLATACGPATPGAGESTGGVRAAQRAPVVLQVGAFPQLAGGPGGAPHHLDGLRPRASQRHHAGGRAGTNATKLLAQLAANTPPDAASIHPNDLATVAAAGGYKGLDELVAKDRTIDLKLFQTGLLDYFKFKGALLQLPYYSGPSMLFYNKTLFQRSGVKLPEDYDRDGKWTWDGGFLEAARQLTQGAGGGQTFGFHPKARALAMQASAVWSNGGDLIDWAGHAQALLTAPAALEAFQLQADLTTRHRVVPPPAQEAELGGGWDLLRGFTTGRIAMFFGGRGWIPTLKTVKDFLEAFRKAAAPFERADVHLEAARGRRALAPLPAKWGAKWGEMNAVYGASWSRVLEGEVEVKPALEDVGRQWEQLMKG